MKYEKDNLKKSIIRAYSTEENLLHVDMVARATPHAHSLLLFVGGRCTHPWCVYFRPLPRHRPF